MSVIDIKVPNIGDFKDVEIIEILVKIGQEITKGDSIITLESDKSSVEVPSDHSGKISNINVKVGDKVSEGDLILKIELFQKEDIKIDINETNNTKETQEPIKKPLEKKEIKTLPYIKNLDYVLLDQFGYSPYNHNTPSGDYAKRLHYQENRDKESISFINTNQEGIKFFYDEKGFTNITIEETYCPDGLHKELQKLGDFDFIEGSTYTVSGSWQDFNGSYQDRFCGSYIRK